MGKAVYHHRVTGAVISEWVGAFMGPDGGTAAAVTDPGRTDVDHRLGGPNALPEIILGLSKSGQIQQSRAITAADVSQRN